MLVACGAHHGGWGRSDDGGAAAAAAAAGAGDLWPSAPVESHGHTGTGGTAAQLPASGASGAVKKNEVPAPHPALGAKARSAC